jgi:hypothetical protein
MLPKHKSRHKLKASQIQRVFVGVPMRVEQQC